MPQIPHEIKNLINITDEFSKSGGNPILSPVPPNEYQGKQVLINADRVIFNAKRQRTQEAELSADTYEGGDIHMFSHNFISFNTNGSIHLNTLFPDVAQHENTQNYIMLNAPNIFLGMDTISGIPKTYPSENALLGLKTQDVLKKLLNLIKELIQKISDDYYHISSAPGLKTTPVGEIFKDMRKDWNDKEGEPTKGSIGEIRKELKDILSRHVFIKK